MRTMRVGCGLWVVGFVVRQWEMSTKLNWQNHHQINTHQWRQWRIGQVGMA